MARFDIVGAQMHEMGNVPREFYRRTDAKKGKKTTVTQGRTVPGVLLRLERRLNYTLLWVDWETLQKIKVVDKGIQLDESTAKALVGKKIRLKR